MNTFIRLILLSAFSAAALPGAYGDRKWSIVSGSDPLEARAAEYLHEHWQHHWTGGLQTPVSEADWDGRLPAIFIGTPDTNSRIAAEHESRPFDLNPGEEESYHLVFRESEGVSILWIAGSHSKGAMNGAFRLMDHNITAPVELDEARAPVFRFRVGGHKINQSPPRDWSEEDQAAFYARNFINVVWGEKHGPPLSYDARRKFGLGLKVELRFPPAGEEWMRQPENQPAVFHYSEQNRRPVISPFHPLGREAYRAGFARLLQENPDARILYGIFGDYNFIPKEGSVSPADGEPYRYTEAETIREILEIMREVVGERDTLVAFWPWHSFWERRDLEVAFMKEVADAGFGVLYNEAGDNDNWIFKRNNFNAVALMTDDEGRTAFGDNYLSLVSAGGSCESMNPVIAYPLPHVAAYKLRKLTDVGARHFSLWWGSAEGWAYSANLSVIREMIWEPELFQPENETPFDFAEGDPLLRRVAVRDFGEDLAPGILEYWRLLDETIVTDVPEYLPPGSDQRPPPDQSGLHIYDWFQRIGTYTEAVFNGEFPVPLTPETMADEHRFRLMIEWGAHPVTLANYRAVLGRLDRAREHLAGIRQRSMPDDVRVRIEDMAHWTGLFDGLLRAQYNHLRGLAAMQELKGEPLDSNKVRECLLPIMKEDMENTEFLIELVRYFPSNFNISLMHRGVVADIGDRDTEIEMLKGKNAAMKNWIAGRKNIALGASAEASSSQSEDRGPQFAVDGIESTLWHSNHADKEWLQLDLGAIRKIDGIQLHWKFAYPDSFDVAVAASLEGPWKTMVPARQGYDGVVAIDLEEVEARFVRVRGIERGTPDMGFALTQFMVYGR